MTVDEQDVVDLGKAVSRLYENKDFQKVIEELYIDEQALTIGRSFEGSEDQLDTLKAVSHLRSWLDQRIEDAKILKLEKKG